jgi:hypothetical protein
MHNIYYDTEKCGLEIVHVLDQDDLYYEFNTMLIVRATGTNRLYYAQSSGCSCPTPFEEFHYASADDNDLNEITKENIDNFIDVIDSFPTDIDDRQSAIRKVRNLLG